MKRGYHVSRQVEEAVIPQARKFLQDSGFKNVQHTPTGLTEFRTTKGGRVCYVELRVRSQDAQSQAFSVRLSKVRTLERLSLQGQVYLLLSNRDGFRLVEFDDIPNHPEIRVFSAGRPKYWTVLNSTVDLEKMIDALAETIGEQRVKMVEELIRFGYANSAGFRQYHDTLKGRKVVEADVSPVTASATKYRDVGQ